VELSDSHTQDQMMVRLLSVFEGSEILHEVSKNYSAAMNEVKFKEGSAKKWFVILTVSSSKDGSVLAKMIALPDERGAFAESHEAR
jgi:hypothetical protein